MKESFMNRQKGVSLLSVVFFGVLALLVVIVTVKTFPTYTEYLAIKKAVSGVASEVDSQGANPETNIAFAFARRQAIDGFSSITSNDLKIVRKGARIEISFAYEKRIPLVANVSLLIDYSGSSTTHN
jgi:hypothetical protein